MFHLLLSLSLLWALFPWLLLAWHYLLWLLTGWALIIGNWFWWKRGATFSGTLSFDPTGWQWRDSGGSKNYELVDDVVIWPGLIILSFQEGATQRARKFLILRDSVATDDMRRLRVWLRTVLPRVDAP